MRFAFTENNVKKNNDIFPKLKVAEGETVRILMMEDPVGHYVHQLNKVNILPNGNPKMVTKQTSKGENYETFDLQFVSNPICLGDPNTLEERGTDAKNCPACAAAIEHEGVKMPVRRFAMHVVKYKTKAGGSELATPFSCDVLVWAFTDRMFSNLYDLSKEWGNLKEIDLLLTLEGPEKYQKLKVQPGSKSAATTNESRKSIVKETYENNQAPDLTRYCGKKTDSKWITEDVETVLKSYRIANGVEQNKGPVDLSARIGDASVGITDELLDSTSNSEVDEPKSKKPDGEVDFETLAGMLDI